MVLLIERRNIFVSIIKIIRALPIDARQKKNTKTTYTTSLEEEEEEDQEDKVDWW